MTYDELQQLNNHHAKLASELSEKTFEYQKQIYDLMAENDKLRRYKNELDCKSIHKVRTDTLRQCSKEIEELKEQLLFSKFIRSIRR